ncbi:MAG TPA: hypothetical protein VHO50_04480 [Bacteroidales bacterium]|nr:hypothetical protein [Bacteroidales bacterium]
MKKLILLLLLIPVFFFDLKGQQDLVIGTSYQLSIQRQNVHADAWILHNAEFSQGVDLLKWKSSHSLFGSRGIRFSYGTDRGIYFFADASPSISQNEFSPITRLFIGNNGNIGIGTITPKSNFELNTLYSGGHIASFGTRLGYNQWNAIHIGYVEPDNSNYRKAGIAFERVDVHARGKLHFINDIDEGSSSFDLNDSKMVISENGNIGIGTTNPFTKLMLVNMVGGVNTARIGFYGQSGDGGNNMDNGGVRFINDNSPYYSEVAGFRGVDSQQAGLHFYTASSSAPSIKMTITPTGEMGIGTENPGTFKLNVAGNIRANEIVVNTEGADFVFYPEYNLPDLAGVEKYIEENKHLPDVPPASEMQTDGMSVSEMQTTLLQKIEEITLYLIDLKKENSELRNELQQLKLENKKQTE